MPIVNTVYLAETKFRIMKLEDGRIRLELILDESLPVGRIAFHKDLSKDFTSKETLEALELLLHKALLRAETEGNL